MFNCVGDVFHNDVGPLMLRHEWVIKGCTIIVLIMIISWRWLSFEGVHYFFLTKSLTVFSFLISLIKSQERIAKLN